MIPRDPHQITRLAICSMLLLLPIRAFGDGAGTDKISFILDTSETQIFAAKQMTDSNDSAGAITLRPFSNGSLPPQTKSPVHHHNSFERFPTEIYEIPVTNSVLVVVDQRGGFPTGRNQVTPLQIAFGMQSDTIDEEITPVPEPGTWVGAILAAVLVAWSQRRRFRRFLPRCCFYRF
jgi:hypothetical protein